MPRDPYEVLGVPRSASETEINKQNPQPRACKECHMSRGLKDERSGIDVPQLRTRLAATQDTTYPEAENLAPHERLEVRVREQGFRRQPPEVVDDMCGRGTFERVSGRGETPETDLCAGLP